MSISPYAKISTLPTLNDADSPVNPTVISVNEIVPILALNDCPVNPKPSSTVKDPTLAVVDNPVGWATALPSPIIVPWLNVASNPDGWTVSFGIIKDPTLAVNSTPVKLASCEDDPTAVPCSDVIAKPDKIAVSFGAFAVPWLKVK